MRRPRKRLKRGTHSGSMKENIGRESAGLRSARNRENSGDRFSLRAGNLHIVAVDDPFIGRIVKGDLFHSENVGGDLCQLFLLSGPERIEAFHFGCGPDFQRIESRSACRGQSVRGDGQADKAGPFQRRLHKDGFVAGDKILLFIRMKIPLDSAVEFPSRDRFSVPEKLDGKTDRFSAFAGPVRMIRFKGETLPGRGRLF